MTGNRQTGGIGVPLKVLLLNALLLLSLIHIYEKHIRHMTLTIDENGNVSIELKRG